MIVLTDSEVRHELTHARAREIVREAAVAYSSGAATIPPRTHLRGSGLDGELLVMPGYLDQPRALGVKIVSEFPGNKARGSAATHAILVLFDTASGQPVMVMNATYLTLARTAAMSVVAAEHMAIANPHQLAIIGAGGQAEAHAEAFADRFNISELHLCGRDAARANALFERLQHRLAGVHVIVHNDPGSAMRGADIVVAATNSSRPVIFSENVTPGMFVCGVGSHAPGTSEIDPDVVRRAALLAADTRAGGVDTTGDFGSCVADGHVTRDDVAELGELVGGMRPGRGHDSDVTVFKSVGFAALDLVAAQSLFSEAASRAIGSRVPI